MTTHELQSFLATWDHEAGSTVRVLRSLPAGKYDFRAYPEGRTLAEQAWHLAGIDAVMAHSVATGKLDFTVKLPGLEQPRTVAELAGGYERVHAASRAQVAALGPAELERKLASPMGTTVSVSEVLWGWLLHHAIHHRGQLTLMCRLAGGTPPGIYGPTREEMAARQAKG
ncbi:MAG: DinB family protein [Candidatus Eisenbacteria bacterium]|nr:DinB family protein [Candidatus Eisenbacteria bacterium]